MTFKTRYTLYMIYKLNHFLTSKKIPSKITEWVVDDPDLINYLQRVGVTQISISFIEKRIVQELYDSYNNQMDYYLSHRFHHLEKIDEEQEDNLDNNNSTESIKSIDSIDSNDLDDHDSNYDSNSDSNSDSDVEFLIDKETYKEITKCAVEIVNDLYIYIKAGTTRKPR